MKTVARGAYALTVIWLCGLGLIWVARNWSPDMSGLLFAFMVVGAALWND